MITLEQFESELQKHDWLYYLSDSLRVVEKGEANEKRLRNLARDNQELRELFNEYVNKYKNLEE